MKMPIEHIWERLLSNPRAAWPVYQRVDESHPIDFYAGVGSDGARLLMLISAFEPSHAPSYHAFDVLKSRRADGRWTVTVELRRAEFMHVFAHLCDDLIAASRTECKPEEAATYLLARIERWHRLLGRDRSGLLNNQEIRGLIGELLFLQRVCFLAKGPDAAVRSWEGPLDAPQDFRFETRYAEVKTCGPTNLVAWISSAEQLDTGKMPITLSVAVIEAADSLTKGSFTLVSLVERIRAELATSITALGAFDEKLRMSGFTERSEYMKDCFALHAFRYFDVLEDFPRLERRQVSDAIVSLKYQLDLSQCRSFEREDVEI
jgi:hypothetical protein